MKSIKEIKDQVSKELGYKNYKEAKQKAFISNELEKAIDRVIALYAEEAVNEDRIKIDNYLMINTSLSIEHIVEVRNLPLSFKEWEK